MTLSTEQISGLLATQYSLSEQGSGATFVRLAILLTDLLGSADAYAICARAFPVEHEAFARGFSDISLHAGRMLLQFPELN